MYVAFYILWLLFLQSIGYLSLLSWACEGHRGTSLPKGLRSHIVCVFRFKQVGGQFVLETIGTHFIKRSYIKCEVIIYHGPYHPLLTSQMFNLLFSHRWKAIFVRHILCVCYCIYLAICGFKQICSCWAGGLMQLRFFFFLCTCFGMKLCFCCVSGHVDHKCKQSFFWL